MSSSLLPLTLFQLPHHPTPTPCPSLPLSQLFCFSLLISLFPHLLHPLFLLFLFLLFVLSAYASSLTFTLFYLLFLFSLPCFFFSIYIYRLSPCLFFLLSPFSSMLYIFSILFLQSCLHINNYFCENKRKKKFQLKDKNRVRNASLPSCHLVYVHA